MIMMVRVGGGGAIRANVEEKIAVCCSKMNCTRITTLIQSLADHLSPENRTILGTGSTVSTKSHIHFTLEAADAPSVAGRTVIFLLYGR